MERTLPSWEHCGAGATEDDPIGCWGVKLEGQLACLAHLTPDSRAAYLSQLAVGADLDCRGVLFDHELLAAVLSRISGNEGHPVLSVARFEVARFTGEADFSDSNFHGPAIFEGARFEAAANFCGVKFRQGAWFKGAHFAGNADFGGAFIDSDAGFADTCFDDSAWFGGVRIKGRLWLERAQFADDVTFRQATFNSDLIGPLSCGGTVSLEEAEFSTSLNLTLASSHLDARRSRFRGPVTLNARYASIDLTEAMFLHPCRLTTDLATELPRSVIPNTDGLEITASVISLRGVDAAMLTVANVDLRDCVFSGTHHLDQLKLEGDWKLARTPDGIRWYGVMPHWWTRRLIIEEERSWRASRIQKTMTRLDWGPVHPRETVPEAGMLASVYRQLRKAREDAKDEPGAADFYYGEMEMRRHSNAASQPERIILTLYWLISGYGLRASRAILTLAAAITAATIIFATVGFATVGFARASTTIYRPVQPSANGTAPAYQQSSIPSAKPGWGTAFYHAIDSSTSLLHTPGNEALTTAGRATEISLRLLGPVLIGLAVLAIRGRVKR